MRFLIHSLSHTFLVVDITKIGPPTEICPEAGKEQIVPSLRFQSWKDVERFFLSRGANAEVVVQTSAQLKRTSVAVLTIV
jgi:hypothetical protein